MWLKTGSAAINGWVALSVHYQILAAEANVVASKALAKAQADLVIIINADAVAAMGGTMNGDEHQGGRPRRLHRGPGVGLHADEHQG